MRLRARASFRPAERDPRACAFRAERSSIRGMTALRINHVSVSSPDQDASGRFYTELFGAERIPSPNFGFRVDWYRFGDTQLHIFPSMRGAATAHLGITVDEILPIYRRARELGVIDPAFTDWVRVLEDGTVQLYVRDPGGNLVEINGPSAISPRKTSPS